MMTLTLPPVTFALHRCPRAHLFLDCFRLRDTPARYYNILAM